MTLHVSTHWSTWLDELEAAMPYIPGERVIREDDHGHPVYEDTGPTPRFLELARQHQKNCRAMQTEGRL